jgi:hypothetical protein
MTDAQIEAIARAYCVKLGLNPDAEGWGPMGGFRPEWRCQVPKVREAIAMHDAIAEVLGDMEGKG